MTISITVPHNDAFAMRVMAEALLRIAAQSEGFTEEKIDKVIPVLMAASGVTNAASGVTNAASGVISETVSDVPAPTIAPNYTSFDVETMPAPVVTPPIPPTVAPNADSDGYPWDQRIHADSKTLNADGTWRARRKPSDMNADEWATYQESVRSELKALMSIPAIVPPPVPVPSIVELSPLDEPSTFPQLMIWITSHVTDDSKRASVSEQVERVVAQHGLQALPQLNQRPDLIPAVYASLREVL